MCMHATTSQASPLCAPSPRPCDLLPIPPPRPAPPCPARLHPMPPHRAAQGALLKHPSFPVCEELETRMPPTFTTVAAIRLQAGQLAGTDDQKCTPCILRSAWQRLLLVIARFQRCALLCGAVLSCSGGSTQHAFCCKHHTVCHHPHHCAHCP